MYLQICDIDIEIRIEETFLRSIGLQIFRAFIYIWQALNANMPNIMLLK